MQKLSRRERQILDILYERGRATAAEILAALPDPPSYSAIRALLRVLEEKGHVKHEADGPRYVFTPTVPRARARRSALKHLLETFFDDSAADAVAALLDARKLEAQELDRIEEMIERARTDRTKKEGHS
ncbi:MAG TPA: BlaI/MecI/CopY family transcriptional regulator [Bryobacteraceae bacterium]|nr:BlaI/MecI/CopY family transcriptional regulator [Bryobacteraceae bacterium]